MQNPFNDDEDNSRDSSKRPKIVMDATGFFDKDIGVFNGNKTGFISLGKSMRAEDVEGNSRFIELHKKGLRINKTSPERTDKGGNPYIYVYLHRSARSGEEVKFSTQGSWKRLLEMCLDDLIEINFTMKELIEEAKKG